MQNITRSKLGIARMAIVVVVVVIVVIGAAAGLYLATATSSTSTTSSTTTTSTTTSSTTTTSTTSSVISTTSSTSTSSSSTCVPTASNPPSAVTIGASVPLSGDFSAEANLLGGAQAAVAYVNQVRGGIYLSSYCEKVPLKLISYDDQSTPSVAVGIYNKLISQGVDALWGSYGTPIVYAYAPIVEQSGLPMIVTNAFGNNIWLQNFSNIYCICPLASVYGTIQATELMQHIAALGGPKVVNASIIADQNENVIAQADSYYQVFTNMGIKVVYNTTVPDGLTSYATQVQAVKAANPGLLFVFIEDTPSLTTFTKELAVAGVHPSIYINSGVAAPGVIQSLGSAALGSLTGGGWIPSVAPTNESDVAQQLSFYQNYSQTQGWSTSVQQSATYGFGGIMVMADAIQSAGTLDHAAIIKALAGPFYTIFGPYDPAQPYHTVNYSPASLEQAQMVNGTLQVVTVYPPGPGTYPVNWNLTG